MFDRLQKYSADVKPCVNLRYVMGKISANDRILIENLKKEKRWDSKILLNGFPSKEWSRSGLDSLLRRIDARASAEWKIGSGRPRSAKTSVNISEVEDLICSQDDAPGTLKSPREIEQITGIARSSVRCTLKKDLAFKS